MNSSPPTYFRHRFPAEIIRHCVWLYFRFCFSFRDIEEMRAKRFFRKLLKGLRYVPRAIITDKLGSYAAAKKELLPSVEHRRDRWLNNRAENSHETT